MIDIYFFQEFPDVYRDRVTELIREFELLLPMWVQRVEVRNQLEDHDAWASMCLLQDYRHVKLYISSQLFEQTRDFQREAMLHEIAHCYNVQPTTVAREILHLMIPNGEETEDPAAKQLYQVLSERIRFAVESANTDLTYSLLRYVEKLKGEASA